MSPPARPTLYCGAPLLRPSTLFRRDPKGGAAALFANRRVAWSFNTRTAISAACDMLGLGAGDEILAPAYNCGSEIDPLLAAGLTVTLYPVKRDLSVDWAHVMQMVTPRTRAIYVTHYFGYLQPDLETLRRFCDARDLRIIEDCALSLLSGAPPPAGRVGDVSVFCFYKFFPVIGGGALVDNRRDRAELPGFRGHAPARHAIRPLIRGGIKSAIGTGYLGRRIDGLRGRGAPPPTAPPPTDSSADMPHHYYFDPDLKDARMSPVTRRMLRGFDIGQAIATRRRNWQSYHALLKDVPGITLLRPDLPPEVCPLNFPILVDNRDAVAATLQSHGIEANPWWAGFHQGLDWSGQDTAIHLKNTVLTLPLHPDITSQHAAYICGVLCRTIGAKTAD